MLHSCSMLSHQLLSYLLISNSQSYLYKLQRGYSNLALITITADKLMQALSEFSRQYDYIFKQWQDAIYQELVQGGTN